MERRERIVHGTSARVVLVGPVAPPYGGMALQGALLQRLLTEDGVGAQLLGYNEAFSHPWRVLEAVPAVRTVLRLVRLYVRFWKSARNCEVVHILAASWLYFFLIVCPIVVLGRLRDKRVVLNYRAGGANDFLKRCAWCTRPFFQMADVNTTPSRFLAQVIQRRVGVPVSIVPNIVDFSSFRYRQRTSFQPKLLVTRHLEPLYDMESIIRAFQQVQKRFPEASLSIVGSGSQEAYLRDLADRWRLSGVEFLGHVQHEALPEIYDQCDILVNASRVDNFPGSLMEASAAGLLVVSTNAGGIPFIYEHRKSALLVDVGDWEALAAEVVHALDDQVLARTLTAAAVELCMQCDWRNVRCALYGVYGFALPEEEGQRSSAAPHLVQTPASNGL